MKFQTWTKTLLLCLLISIINSALFASPGITKESVGRITSSASTWWDDRYGDGYLNSTSFNQDSILSFKGWQYAVWYNQDRYVTVGRRQLPSGQWQEAVLRDYKQTENDNHNTISMGISPADGRIHISFDHHISTLHYRKSTAGLASNPSNFNWSPSLFEAVQDNFGGGRITSLTYPHFMTAPDGTFLFYARIGTSGEGDNNIWQYNNNGSWTALGKFLEGLDENAYFHGINFDSNNRLHATWCWRATSSGYTNHDLLYAYSDDYGRTWKDNRGSTLATTGSNPIDPRKNFYIWTIPQQGGLINQEAMICDAQNRVHVFSREDIGGTNYQMHYWRDTNGTWHRQNTGFRTKIWDNRSKIAYDNDGNVYGVLPNLQLASASIASNYTDWSILDTSDDGKYHHSEPLIDRMALRSQDSRLYVFVQEGTTRSTSPNINVLEYSFDSQANKGILGDVNEDGTVSIVDGLLVAQYYVRLVPDDFNPDFADVNCDTQIDIVDALLIAKFYVGLIDTFCVN